MTRVVLQQTLHGYDRGHSLLASSLALPDDVHLRMLKLSDLTGPVWQPRFETYLTGYDIVELGMYALARSWRAVAGERPGTVWTHTLLVRFEDLAAIVDLSVLLSALRKPDVVSLPQYEHEVKLSASSSPGKDWAAPDPHASGLLRMLYSPPIAPVTAYASSAGEVEQAVLMVWSQQWPRLRRSFRFCTGVLASSGSALLGFDLQLGPFFTRSIPIETAVRDALPEWERVAANDLAGDNRLRQFLREFGAESERGRSDFAALVRVFIAWCDRAEPVRLIGALKALDEDGARFTLLARSVLSGRAELLDEVALLLVIIADDYCVRLLTEEVVVARAQDLARASVCYALMVVEACAATSSARSGRVIAAIAQVLTGDEVELATANESAILSMVAMRPELAAGSAVLGSSAARQRHVLEAISRGERLSPVTVRRIVRRLLAYGDGIASCAAGVFGSGVVEHVLDFAAARDGVADPEWQQIVAGFPDTVRAWLDKGSEWTVEVAFIVARALSPRDRAVEANAWRLPAIVGCEHDLLLTFSFLVGLRAQHGVAEALCLPTFQVLHDRVRAYHLLPDALRQLQRELPPSEQWRDWDTCDKLRRALADSWVDNDRPPGALLVAVSDVDTLGRILEYLSGSKRGRRFVRELQRLSPVAIPRSQHWWDVLKSWWRDD